MAVMRTTASVSIGVHDALRPAVVVGSSSFTGTQHSQRPTLRDGALVSLTVRTVAAGFKVLVRSPLAVVPLIVEGLAGALLIGFGLIPADGGSAPVTAAFPIDIYFDVKHALAYGSSWLSFAAAVSFGIAIRSGVLATTLWLAERRRTPLSVIWLRTATLAAIAAVAFLPAAGMYFIATAIRYAPFIWIAAACGLVACLELARRAATLTLGPDAVATGKVPTLGQLLTYAYLLSAVAASMSVLSRISDWLVATLIFFLGPVHALFLLGWREQSRIGRDVSRGHLAVAATAVVAGGLLLASIYDRTFSTPGPPARPAHSGTLLLLGGVDSTSKTGALAKLDARAAGFPRSASEVLSYRGAGEPYNAADTHADLARVAERVAPQISEARPPRDLLTHSQAALVLDRLIVRNLQVPDAAVELAPPPPVPPELESPGPGQSGPGKVGGDVARAVAGLLDTAGLASFDIDAPVSPVHLRPVVAGGSSVSRLAVWALGDSVWLDGDWRRPGQVNVVALTDHVGVASNSTALRAARSWFAGRPVEADDASWRGMLVSVLRYTFEPWRP